MSENSYLVEVRRQFGVVATFRNVPLSRPSKVASPETDNAYDSRLGKVRQSLTDLLSKEGGKVGPAIKAAGAIEVSGISEQTKSKIALIDGVDAVRPNRVLRIG